MEHIGKVYTENCLNDKKKMDNNSKKNRILAGVNRQARDKSYKDTPKLQYFKRLLLKLPHKTNNWHIFD